MDQARARASAAKARATADGAVSSRNKSNKRSLISDPGGGQPSMPVNPAPDAGQPSKVQATDGGGSGAPSGAVVGKSAITTTFEASAGTIVLHGMLTQEASVLQRALSATSHQPSLESAALSEVIGDDTFPSAERAALVEHLVNECGFDVLQPIHPYKQPLCAALSTSSLERGDAVRHSGRPPTRQPRA